MGQVAEPQRFDVMASLYLRGDAFDPASVTGLAGVEPQHAHLKGAVRTFPSGRTSRPSPDGLWSYSVQFDEATIEDCVRKLLTDLGPRIGEARALPGIEKSLIAVFIQCEEPAKNNGSRADIALSSQLMGAIAALGFDLEIGLVTYWDNANG